MRLGKQLEPNPCATKRGSADGELTPDCNDSLSHRTQPGTIRCRAWHTHSIVFDLALHPLSLIERQADHTMTATTVTHSIRHGFQKDHVHGVFLVGSKPRQRKRYVDLERETFAGAQPSSRGRHCRTQSDLIQLRGTEIACQPPNIFERTASLTTQGVQHFSLRESCLVGDRRQLQRQTEKDRPDPIVQIALNAITLRLARNEQLQLRVAQGVRQETDLSRDRSVAAQAGQQRAVHRTEAALVPTWRYQESTDDPVVGTHLHRLHRRRRLSTLLNNPPGAGQLQLDRRVRQTQAVSDQAGLRLDGVSPGAVIIHPDGPGR